MHGRHFYCAGLWHRTVIYFPVPGRQHCLDYFHRCGGRPSASLVAIAIILTAIGLPVEAIGVLLVFDRILDMSRTATNVFGDACCTVIVARLQGEELPELEST